MKDWFLFKLRILLKSIEIFRNWYLYPLVYFNLTSKPFVIFETRTDLKLKIRTKSTDLMALTHVWLIEEYRNADFKIGNNDTVVDVGAHIGLFSLFAAQFCKKGRVFCFEPVNDNYELLLENIKLNNITNIIPFNCAVSQNSSKVKIFLNDDQSSHSMFIPNSESIEVPSISIHDIFKENEIKKCDLLKLDCEGAEYDIIKSIKQEFFGFINKIAIEYHFADSKPDLLEELVKKLKKSFFHITTRELFSDIGFLFATRK